MTPTHPIPAPDQLAWHNSRPHRWWTIARLKAWAESKERRDATTMRAMAMQQVRSEA